MASLFDTNEVNSTFYRVPTARMTREWARKVAFNPRFAFTAKLFRGFTHERESGESDRKAYLEGIAPLAEEGRLGAVLIQFPVSFHHTPENRERLARILGQFAALPLAAEFRHRSWDDAAVLELLASHGAAFVNIDQPWLGDNLRTTTHVTGGVAYYRFHGRNAEKWFGPNTSNEERYNYLYSERQLEPWAERIREGAATVRASRDAERAASRGVYAILNNHFRGQAVANALQLQRLLTGEAPAAPATLLESYPGLAGFPSGGAPSQPKPF